MSHISFIFIFIMEQMNKDDIYNIKKYLQKYLKSIQIHQCNYYLNTFVISIKYLNTFVISI